MPTRPRTPQALTSRTPTVKEAEGWKQRVAREELAASGLWGHPGFVTPNINTTASGSSSLPASPTAARTGAQYHSPQRPPAPWLPWVEVAATARYETRPLGPGLRLQGSDMPGALTQPPPALMALPHGSHDKAVERAYSRYGHMAREQHLRSLHPAAYGHRGGVGGSAPVSPSRAAAAAAIASAASQTERLNAVHTGLGAGGGTGPAVHYGERTAEWDRTASLLPGVVTPAVPSPAPFSRTAPLPPTSALSTTATNHNATFNHLSTNPMGLPYGAGNTSPTGNALTGTGKALLPNRDTYHGLTRRVKELPVAPQRVAAAPCPYDSLRGAMQGGTAGTTAASAAGGSSDRTTSPERTLLAQQVHAAECALSAERAATHALRGVLRAATHGSMSADLATLHYTYPVKV